MSFHKSCFEQKSEIKLPFRFNPDISLYQLFPKMYLSFQEDSTGNIRNITYGTEIPQGDDYNLDRFEDWSWFVITVKPVSAKSIRKQQFKLYGDIGGKKATQEITKIRRAKILKELE